MFFKEDEVHTNLLTKIQDFIYWAKPKKAIYDVVISHKGHATKTTGLAKYRFIGHFNRERADRKMRSAQIKSKNRGDMYINGYDFKRVE